MNSPSETDLNYLRAAARLAMRGHGGAEPNPLVGCVIVAADGSRVGWGYHRRCGEAHAEIIALKRAGNRATGATMYCTLEPCTHSGRTPPCVPEIIAARLARVVIARRDPNPQASGGVEALTKAGIKVDVVTDCPEAIAVSDPFVHRVATGRPWVIAKWAQTLDGKIATRTGESKWISGPVSRAMVHRERGRVDITLTGIGTVMRDDPQLTARDGRVRRIARRVVIDPALRTPPESTIATTTSIAPTTIVCTSQALSKHGGRADKLQTQGVDLIDIVSSGGEIPMDQALCQIAQRYNANTVLVEAGQGLLSRLFRSKLVNEAWVFVSPRILGDPEAMSSLAGWTTSEIDRSLKLELRHVRRRGDDVLLQFRCGT